MVLKITSKFIKKEAKKIGIPVYICMPSSFRRILKKRDKSLLKKFDKIKKTLNGLYIHYWTGGKNDLSKSFIYISRKNSLGKGKNKKMTNSRILGHLYHEAGHHVCKKKNCQCLRNPKKPKKILSEVHAHNYVLSTCLKRKIVPVLKDYMIYLWWNAVGGDKAAKKIIKKDIWKKCEKFMKKV